MAVSPSSAKALGLIHSLRDFGAKFLVYSIKGREDGAKYDRVRRLIDVKIDLRRKIALLYLF